MNEGRGSEVPALERKGPRQSAGKVGPGRERVDRQSLRDSD